MATPKPPDPVKVMAAVLFAPGADWPALRQLMTRRWGSVDFEGVDHSFNVTDYYESEMGADLRRRMVSFANLATPESLPELKLAANEIETALLDDGGRSVNVDVGYFDIHKIVLASGKYDAQKIHLGRGIYADIVCRYSEGEFHPYEWTFPDFRQRLYDREFLEIRRVYKRQLRERRPTKKSDVIGDPE